MYPIYFEQDQVSPAVLAAEAAIRAAEGQFHVGGNYYASEADAATQRRWAAEKQVRAALREAAKLKVCVFCDSTIDVGESSVEMAGAFLHRDCARTWDDFANGLTDGEMLEQFDSIILDEQAAA